MVTGIGMDPGRERRAEQRARALLRSCVNEEEWSMYRDLGFLRIWGRLADGPGQPGRAAEGAPYAYLVYPHKPIVAYLPQTRELLSEHCVQFPDETRPYGSALLPDSDDVLAKWMALTGDEERLITSATCTCRAGRSIPSRSAGTSGASGSGSRSACAAPPATTDTSPRRDVAAARAPARIGCPRCPRTSTSTSSTAAAH